MLLPARTGALSDKLDQFSPDEKQVLREIVVHHYRQRSELQEKFDPKIVDSATNKAVAMRIIDLNSGTYTFSPNEHWQEYLEDVLLTEQPAKIEKRGFLDRLMHPVTEEVQ